MGRGSEPAVLYPGLEFDHRRMETPGIGDAEHDSGLRRGAERNLGALHVERKRLLHHNVFAGGRGPLDLYCMLAVRRRKDDGIDRRIDENRIEIILQCDPVFGAKRLRRGPGSIVAGGEADHATLALDRADERPPPAADTDDRGPDHDFAASMSRTPRSAR